MSSLIINNILAYENHKVFYYINHSSDCRNSLLHDYLKVCNINVNSVTNLLLSKIPGINQFVETTTNTGLYAISQMDKKELITSSYNIDFLVSFYQSGKRTIICIHTKWKPE